MIRIAALALLLATPAVAQERVSRVNGSQLLGFCAGASHTGCDAYLSGVADTYGEIGRGGGVCIPAAVTGTQLREVMIKFLHDHPQDLQRSAGALASHAFKAAYACR